MRTEIPDTVVVTTHLIINAISRALHEQYTHPVYVQGSKQGLNSPCFFIEHIKTTGQRLTRRRSERKLSVTVHYFPPEMEDEAQSIFDVGDELYTLLELIQISDRVVGSNPIHVRGTDMTYAIDEGVLHFMLTIVYQQLDERLDPHMEVLQQNNKTKRHQQGGQTHDKIQTSDTSNTGNNRTDGNIHTRPIGGGESD